MKEIPLSHGLVALVDDEDFEWLNQWKWQFNGYYAARSVKRNKRCKSVLMHRVIMNNQDAQVFTDHINGNKLDNRRCNLRLCTHSQNMMNVSKSPNGSSRFKGVYMHKKTGLWIARINANNKHHYLGVFETQEDAAFEYNKAAIKLHGEFARLNNLSEDYKPSSTIRISKANKSGYRGVVWHNCAKTWAAQISVSAKTVAIGRFDSPESAARAYDAKAKQLYGENAKLNFPDE